MQVKENGEYPECEIKMEDGQVRISGQFDDDQWSGIIRIDNDKANSQPLLELDYIPASGEKGTIRIPEKR